MSVLSLLKFITRHPLNRGRKLSALRHFVQWQIASRLIDGDIVYPWVNDSKFLVRSGETGLTGSVYAGLQEFADMAFLLHALRKEDLFVDVGANVGSYSILACAAIGASGVALEPVPSTYRRLVENLRINQLENRVRSLNIGAGDTAGRLQFSSDMDVCNRVLAPGESRVGDIEVPVETLDAVLAGQVPWLMKIDVEGYETAVLQGAQATLQHPALNAVIMEINGSGRIYGFDEGNIAGMMAGFGFSKCTYCPVGRQLSAHAPGDALADNTLFIRDVTAAQDRVKTAPPVSVHGQWL